MATQLREFTAVRRTQVMRQGRYPWAGAEGWTNGSVWRIERGVDFECTAVGMRSTLYQKATKMRKRVMVQKISDAVLEFQFEDEE